MRHGNMARIFIGASMMLALSACSEIEGVDYLSFGHPADPDAQSGRRAPMSRSLDPELINVRPDLKAGAPAKTGGRPAPTPVPARVPMDHSKHGGGN